MEVKNIFMSLRRTKNLFFIYGDKEELYVNGYTYDLPNQLK